MDTNFLKVKNYLSDLDYSILNESEEDAIFVVENESADITNLVIVCAEPILILEQFLFDVKADNMQMYKELLMKNRDIVHGAFALNDTGDKIIFRDTLQLENLDLNELQGTLNSLSLLMSEYSERLIEFSK